MNEEKCVRVLIVDDDESFRRPLAERLPKFLKEGCEVEAVKNGEEAIQAVIESEGGYDVALIDQVLYPPPDGIEVMRRIKELCPYIQVIIFTGWEMDSGLEALREGAYRYMSKSSFNVEELAIMVEMAAEYQRLMKRGLLTKVLETSGALQSSLELDGVLKIILRGIQDLGYDRVRLYLLSKDGQKLAGKMQAGGPQGFEAISRPLAEDAYSQATLQTKAPRIYKAGELGPDLWEKELEKEDIAEWADIPLIARGQPIGKMSIDNKLSRRKLVSDELEPLMVFANQAANAIYNAGIYGQSQKDLANLSRLYDASSRIASSLDLDETLQVIIRSAVVATQGHSASLSLINEDDQQVIRATVGYDEEMKKKTEFRPSGVSIEVMQTKKPFLMPNIDKFMDIVNPGMIEAGFKAAICLPLLGKERPIGVMWVNYVELHPFPSKEVRLLQTFANQAAIAIEKARLHRETHRRAEELAFLNRVGRALASSLELEQVLKTVMREVADVLRVEAGSVQLLDDRDKKLVIEAAVGAWAEKTQGLRFLLGQGIAGWVAREGQPLLVLDAREEPRFYPGIDEATGLVTRSLLAVPLQAKGKVIGVIEAVNKIEGDFSQADLELLSSMALAAGIAIENARLYEAEHQRAQELAGLHQISQAMSALANLRQVYSQLTERIGTLLDVEMCGVLLWDDEENALVSQPPFYGVPEELIRSYRIPVLRGSKLWRIWQEEDFFISNDVLSDPLVGEVGLRELARLVGVRATLLAPMTVGKQRIGIVQASNKLDGSLFDENDARLLCIFANQAALAIENAELFSREQERARRWQTVADAGRRVSQSLGSSPREVLEITAKAACKIVGAECAIIYPYYADTRTFDTENYSGHGLQRKDFPLKDKRRELPGWAGQIIDKGRIIINDVTEEARDYAEKTRFIREEGVKAFVGMRLDAAGGPVGVLYVNFRHTHRWTEEELEAIQPFADQAALTIQHTILHRKILEQAKKGQQRLQTVVDMSRAFSSSLELDQVIDILLSALAGPFPQAHSRMVNLYNPDTRQLVIHRASYKHYWSEQKARETRRSIPLEGSIGGWVATHRRSANVPDVLKDARYLPLIPETRSQLSVPIKFGDELIGVLTLESRDLAAFDDEDQRLLEALADQAGVAIENARRYEKLQETQATLEARTAVAWMGMAGSTWFHNIRGRAAAIKDWILLIRQKLSEANSAAIVSGDLDSINAEVEKLLEIPTRQVLPTKGELETVLIHALLRRVAERLCWPREDIQFVLQLRTDEEVAAVASGHWLEVAVEMLVKNALQAMTEGGRLTIESLEDNGQIKIRIADTGPGIPAPLQAKLFKQPITSEEGAKGSGMGLLMTKTILERYKGNISLERTGRKGTTFVISLPRAAENVRLIKWWI